MDFDGNLYGKINFTKIFQFLHNPRLVKILNEWGWFINRLIFPERLYDTDFINKSQRSLSFF